MKPLAERQKTANSQLAPYAVPHGEGLGRAVAEPEDETRFPLQRDRDRIIHTDAFRRLKGKTQVFVEGQGDHYRTRLTHTMEVAQLSRDLARAMSLNEDLAECIALAHDLGHPPFGHAGEEALHHWMQERGSRFEHNEQSLRIVTRLAKHSSAHPGLNLSGEVLEGLQKHHPSPRSGGVSDGKPIAHGHTLEAQLVNIADEIAYNGHDCEDGLRAALFTRDELASVALVHEAIEHSQGRGAAVRGAIIHMLVLDLLDASSQAIQNCGVSSLEDVYKSRDPIIGFSPSMRQKLDDLRSFLWKHMYTHPAVLERSQSGQRVILHLCNEYEHHPTDKIREFQELAGGSVVEAIKDYVSGMTDSYATQQMGSLEQTRGYATRAG